VQEKTNERDIEQENTTTPVNDDFLDFFFRFWKLNECPTQI